MLKNKKIKKPTLSEDNVPTPAGSTIVAPGDASKAVMMNSVLASMSGMSKGEMADFLDKALALIGHEADSIPNGTADNNRGTIMAKTAVKEDVIEAFGEELSEETKEKIETIFEAALESRLAIEMTKLEEQSEAAVSENVSNIIEELIEKTDGYLTYVAENWVKENQVAIDKSLRSEIAEDFMASLGALYEQRGIVIPDSEIDAVEKLQEEYSSLEEKYNSLVEENLNLNEEISDRNKESIIAEACKDLTVLQAEKLNTLLENVDYDSDTFEKKVKTIKESFILGKNKKSDLFMITEENDYSSGKKIEESIDPNINRIARAIDRI